MNSKVIEALNKIGNISAFVAENCGNAETAKYMNDIISIVQDAVAEPLRNCEVGTAEEQGERCLAQFEQWRQKGEGKKLIVAIMEWSQMPYEEVK